MTCVLVEAGENAFVYAGCPFSPQTAEGSDILNGRIREVNELSLLFKKACARKRIKPLALQASNYQRESQRTLKLG